MNSPCRAHTGILGLDGITGGALPRGCTSSTPMVVIKFRLFLAGDALTSALALTNLLALCRSYLPGLHTIGTVDVFREPQRAVAEGITMTPTLVRLTPGPMLRIIGTLVQTQTVLLALGLEAAQV